MVWLVSKLVICVLQPLFVLPRVGRKRRRSPAVENLFEDVDQLDMLTQTLDMAIDAEQPLIEGDSEGLLEVSGVPIRVEIHLEELE